MEDRDIVAVLAEIIEIIPPHHPLAEDLSDVRSFATAATGVATLENCWLMAKASIQRRMAIEEPDDGWKNDAINIFKNETMGEI